MAAVFALFSGKAGAETPYILVLCCADGEAERLATDKLAEWVEKSVVKSKTVGAGGVELTVEVRIDGSATAFANELTAIPGVLSAALVSYNGEYMS